MGKKATAHISSLKGIDTPKYSRLSFSANIPPHFQAWRNAHLEPSDGGDDDKGYAFFKVLCIGDLINQFFNFWKHGKGSAKGYQNREKELNRNRLEKCVEKNERKKVI